MENDLYSLFERRWHCEVVSSGYHNGAQCDYGDPHDPALWHCGYRWIAPALTEKEAVQYGIPRRNGVPMIKYKCTRSPWGVVDTWWLPAKRSHIAVICPYCGASTWVSEA